MEASLEVSRFAAQFFYFSSRLKNLKRANGEILACSERFDTNPEVVKNFGIFLRYNSRSGTHNMYKEYRDTTRTGAVAKMFNDMAGVRVPLVFSASSNMLDFSVIARAASRSRS